MKRVCTLACFVCLLVLAAPTVEAAEETAPGADPAPDSATSAVLADALEAGPHHAPLAASQSCPDYYYAGRYAVWPPDDPKPSCVEMCTGNGDTYYFHWHLGFALYECYCCPG